MSCNESWEEGAAFGCTHRDISSLVYALTSVQERTHVYICTLLFGKNNS